MDLKSHSHPIIWKKDYSVGVKEMDGHHQTFFSILNELFVSIYAEKDKQWIRGIFSQLENYAKFHFSAEETYFDAFKYEHADHHKEMHEYFRNKLSEIERRYETETADVTGDMVKFLEEWFVNHINRADKMYTKCFNDNGVV